MTDPCVSRPRDIQWSQRLTLICMPERGDSSSASYHPVLLLQPESLGELARGFPFLANNAAVPADIH